MDRAGLCVVEFLLNPLDDKPPPEDIPGNVVTAKGSGAEACNKCIC